MPPENPFLQLISACNDNPTLLQQRYDAHRCARNAQYKARLLSPDFPGWQVDETLRRLHESSSEKEALSIDPRHNLSFWARPPPHIRDLVAEIQGEIRTVAPSLWFTPADNLHTTVLEVASARSPGEIDALVSRLSINDAAAHIADYPFSLRTRLVQPMVSYDATALALSFLPAADEGDDMTRNTADKYTYHHLRRDVFDQVAATGVEINSRYAVPSAHITIARFITQDGFLESGSDGRVDSGRVRGLVEKIEDINDNLQKSTEGEWDVGQERGLDFHKGRSWYGGGEAVLEGGLKE